MYGMVLVMALSGAGKAPDCCFLSCCRPVYAGCYGGGCYGGGCYGGGCYGGGCYGGGCYGGGCYGGGCYGGGCYGGGCYGGSCYGGGCYGGCYGGPAYAGGCYGGVVVVPHGTPMGPAGGGGTPDKVPPPDKKPMNKPDGDKKPGEEGALGMLGSATVVVDLPAGAVFSFGDFTSKSTLTQRTITLSDMVPGREFTYTLRAEIVRDGKTLAATKTIKVAGGQNLHLAFDQGQFASSIAAK